MTPTSPDPNSISGLVSPDPRRLSPEDFRAALGRAMGDNLWLVSLGLAFIYCGTAISHAVRLEPPLRMPLAVTATLSALLYLMAALRFRSQPPSTPWAHPLGALLAIVALTNETLQQQTLLQDSLQIYTTLYLLAVGVFFLSTRWLTLCLLLGIAGWAAAVWRAEEPWPMAEWAYAHFAAAALGCAAHVMRVRTLRRVEFLRQADANRAAHLHQALQELRASESLFRQFADHSGQVFWINDGRTHQVAYINQVYETLMGRPRDRLHDDPLDWLGAVHPEDRPRVSRAYLDCADSRVFDEHYRIIRADGAIRWIHDHGFLIGDEASGDRRIGGIMRDVTSRVLAEKQLRQSEQTTRAMLHAIPDMILRVRVDGSFVIVQSPRSFEAPWLHPAAAPTNLREFLPQDLLAAGEKHLAAALETGEVQTHEYLWRANGEEQWREWRIAPIGSGEVLVIVRDISRRKAVEFELTRSREQLSNLIADIDGIVYECDANTLQFSFVSARAEKMLGYPLEEWFTHPQFFPDLVHPDDRERILNFCRERTALGLDHEMSFRVLAADGRVLWVQEKIRVVKDADGKPSRLRGLLIDTTEAMRAAQALGESQMILNRAQEIANLGSWTWDLSQNRVIWSPQMYRIYGITPAQFDGTLEQAIELIHPADRHIARRFCDRATAAGEVELIEYRVLRPDGDERIVRADGELHHDSQGRITRIIGTLQDITEVRAAEAERARLEEELRQVQKLEAVGTLASGVAHDFNNLLTAINGYVDLARQSLPTDHASLSSLQMIELATDQAASVTQSLLTFGHHTPLQMEPIDLAPNIRQSLLLLRRLLPASIELIEDLPGDGEVWVNADGHQLQQVWLNLAINARDAMTDGGKLIIRLRRFSDDLTSPQDSWHGRAVDTAVITVTDHGTGMSEATMARIFEPYFTTKPRGQGTGLGMSIVHGIVTEHTGRIRVQSEPGKGTCFTIYLPSCIAPEPAAEPSASSSTPAGHGETILLAEDNEFVRAIITSSLQHAGYRTISVADGEEALDAFHAHRDQLNLIILDLDLPKRSGDQCLDKIRGAGDALPAILITGNGIDAPGQPRLRDEVVLMKPFQMARLIEVVNEMVSRS